MRYTISFVGEPEDVLVMVAGQVTVAEMESYLADRLADPRWLPTMSVLVDATAAETRRLTSSDIEQIANFFAVRRTQLGTGRRAIVTTDDGTFGLTRMWQTLAEANGVEFETRVFRALEEARAWLESGDPG